MIENTSIELGNHFEEFINNFIKSGRFKSKSDVIKASLKLLEEDELAKKELQNQLELGHKSGYDKNFETTSFLNEMKSKYNKK